jgi:hypothetical protein
LHGAGDSFRAAHLECQFAAFGEMGQRKTIVLKTRIDDISAGLAWRTLKQLIGPTEAAVGSIDLPPTAPKVRLKADSREGRLLAGSVGRDRQLAAIAIPRDRFRW